MNSKEYSLYYAYICNIFEAYSFNIFIFLSPILSEVFFKVNNKNEFYIYSSLIFSAGFILKPIGSIYFPSLGFKPPTLVGNGGL